MTSPFTPLWARLRPSEGAAPRAWTSWPGPVIAAQTARHEGRTLYGSISFTNPHRLHIVDADTGERVAPPVLCDAGPNTFALAAGPAALVAAGARETVEPLSGARRPYEADVADAGDADNVGLVTAAVGPDEPVLVTVHPFQSIAFRDASAGGCLAAVPLGDMKTPDQLCAGLVDGRLHAVVGKGAELCTYAVDTDEVVARWTIPDAASGSDSDATSGIGPEILRAVWAPGVAGTPAAVLTADSHSRLTAWAPDTGEPLGTEWPLPGSPLHLSAAVLDTRDGGIPVVACTHADGIRLLRTDTGRVLLDLRPSARTRTAHLTADGLLLLGTHDGPVALRLDTERLLAASGDHAAHELDLGAWPMPAVREQAGSPDADGGPSHADLVDLWGADQVIVLAEHQVPADITGRNREALCRLGLPLSPLPGLPLDQDLALDGPAPLEEVGVGPADPDDPDARYVPEGLDGYYWLGTWHDDDLVLSPAGAVEVIGTESDYESALPVNSDLAAFAAFCYQYAVAALRQEPEYGAEAQEERADELEHRLRAADPLAFAEHGSEHWADALSDLASGM
ncbi:SUKH-4 family immunity protein [Streptomyces sp. YGL11-2]|uniref:SUKH-4 family immunity protein n=1 Tax=Streptomyces sp. YGL11-2 TaxID=3414028 RepID=UPI003CECE667